MPIEKPRTLRLPTSASPTRQHLVGAAVGQAGGGAQDAQVVAGRPGRVEARRLERRADDPQRLVDLVVGLAADRRGARGRVHQAQDHPQRGRLAGAVGAEEAGHGARLDVEAELVDRPDLAAEHLGQAADLDPADRRSAVTAVTPPIKAPSAPAVRWQPGRRAVGSASAIGQPADELQPRPGRVDGGDLDVDQAGLRGRGRGPRCSLRSVLTPLAFFGQQTHSAPAVVSRARSGANRRCRVATIGAEQQHDVVGPAPGSAVEL